MNPKKTPPLQRPFADQTLQLAALARQALGQDAIDKIDAFIINRQNKDGGFHGQTQNSDLRSTLFSVAVLRSLNHSIPLRKVWKYVRSFKTGANLDLLQLSFLTRLRLAFPYWKQTKKKLLNQLQKHPSNSIFNQFLFHFAIDDFHTEIPASPTPLDAPTPTLAAAILLNPKEISSLKEELLNRAVQSGGFAPDRKNKTPNLLSTASALFVLLQLKTPLDHIQKPTLKYIESLWKKNGGFSSTPNSTSTNPASTKPTSTTEDAEQTFYALLTMGCLIKSMLNKSPSSKSPPKKS